MTEIRALLSALLFMIAVPAAAAAELRIGFVALEDDPRHDEALAYARIELRPAVDARAGAELGVADSQVMVAAGGDSVTLAARTASDAAGLVASIADLTASGVRFIVLDLPADMVEEVAVATQQQPVVLVNATAGEDWLRAQCHPHLLHTAASDRMGADAMAQYLRQRDWSRVLMLVGEADRDRQRADAFAAAAERYRLQIVDERRFTLATDPAHREARNPLLLTGGVDYDVVYLADSDGEFGRYLPYATQLPRPVLGTTGLVATEWHWALERYGAPQVNSRFEDMSGGRRMAGQDWAAWIAVRAIATALTRSGGSSQEEVEAYLRGPRFGVDGSKGVRLSFRSWNGQLRMPMLLATHNSIIAVPPLEGFLHHVTTLDTLGTDAPEHQCR